MNTPSLVTIPTLNTTDVSSPQKKPQPVQFGKKDDNETSFADAFLNMYLNPQAYLWSPRPLSSSLEALDSHSLVFLA